MKQPVWGRYLLRAAIATVLALALGALPMRRSFGTQGILALALGAALTLPWFLAGYALLVRQWRRAGSEGLYSAVLAGFLLRLSGVLAMLFVMDRFVLGKTNHESLQAGGPGLGLVAASVTGFYLLYLAVEVVDLAKRGDT